VLRAVRAGDMRIYNEWLADFCSTQPGRLRGPGLDPEQLARAAITEIERVPSAGAARPRHR